MLHHLFNVPASDFKCWDYLFSVMQPMHTLLACSFGWWLMAGALLAGCWWLICSERKVLLAGG
jgi:hypothetical protein